MSDPNETGREFCMQHIEQCKKCSKRACNSQSLEFEKNISCVKCTPDKKTNCNTVDKDITAIECAQTTVGYKNACYIYQNDSVTIRGCLFEAPDIIFKECLDYYSAACSTCNQSDCNRASVENETIGLNSLYIPRAIKNTSFQGCSTPECYNDKIKSTGPQTTNSIQYKDKRLECYRCDGNEECDLIDSTLKPERCTVSLEYDQCYTYIDQGISDIK